MTMRVLAIGLVLGGFANAQMSTRCGGVFPDPIVAKPVIYGGLPAGAPQDASIDCLMWQTFIYLNWPVLAGQRGTPDPNAAFGAPGQTVWESFKTVDDVFLPNGADPGPWNTSTMAVKGVPSRLRASVANRKVRVMKQTSKVSGLLKGAPPPALDETEQVGGGVLVDQAGQTVYYEMLMNQLEYDYIRQYTLYEANAQYSFAQKTGISLPSGSTSTGSPGSIEIKAAWKVLTAAELAAKPVRFHTTQAILPGGKAPVTMGLTGLHVIQRAENMFQMLWSTFVQIDNAPPLGPPPTTGSFSFFRPGCTTCSINVQTIPPAPTQVMQTIASPAPAATLNTFMQTAIAGQNPNSPWQFYQLLNVQWPTFATAIPTPPQPVTQTSPLPNGTPNVNTLLNPVLETFFQQHLPNGFSPGQPTSCLDCHTGATAANPKKQANDFGSSYSFLFFHAKPARASAGTAPARRAP